MIDPTLTMPSVAIEYELARRSFPEFLSYVKILEPPQTTSTTGESVIPFEKWPHLMDVAADFSNHRLMVYAKARQVGLSWLLAAYVLWVARFQPGARVLELSRGEKEAADLLAKSVFIHTNLPEWMQGRIGRSNTQELGFPDHNAKVTALPSTRDAGRSETASLVIQDEADYHEYLDLNYAAVKPTIDAGGQLIQVSTVNKRKMLSLFKELYKGAPGNGYSKRFISWTARPDRDMEWYAKTKASIPSTIDMSPDLYMEQEYPSNEMEALSPSKVLGFFAGDTLREMLAECVDPIETRMGGLVKIWKRPKVATKYVAGGDIAWGEKGAYSALIISDWQTGEQVAEIHGRPPLDEAASAIVDLCREYNDAYVGIENNSEGVNVCQKMVDLGYLGRMYRTKDKPGWTTTSITRPVMLGELEEAVRARGVKPYSREAVGEMMSFVRNEKGRPEASKGSHDDYVMAWAIMYAMRTHATWGIASGGGAVILLNRR